MLLLGLLAPVAGAQELSGLKWVESDPRRAVFSVAASAEAEFVTEVLDNGYRLRVSFPQASLARDIRDIGEAGIVRGVFPYETDDPDRANFDILLKTVGRLEVAPIPGGYAVAVFEGEAQPGGGATPTVAVSGSDADRDPGPYQGLSPLEQSVVAEIEAAGQPAELAVEPTPAAPAVSPVAPAVSPVEETTSAVSSAGDRTRVVIEPGADSATTAAAPAATESPVVQSGNEAGQRAESAAADAAADAATVAPALPRMDTAPAAPMIPPASMVSRGDAVQVVGNEVRGAFADGPAPTSEGVQPGPGGLLKNVTYSQLPGGRMQINLNVEGVTEEPGIFRTNRPPRIVVDFFGATNAVMDTIQRVGAGAVESIVTAQTDDRTRVILNLVSPVDYEQRSRDGSLVLVMSAPASEPVASTAVRGRPRFETAGDFEFSVENVDFRRTPQGGGTIQVKLSSPEIGVDVREEAGEIIVDFPGTALPPELEKRLDVVDFATPVQTVDTFFTGAGARMIISPVGEYSQSSYQVGDILTVQVNPVSAVEDDREPDEFGYSGEKLSFNFQRISVRAALQVIADFTGLNFVTSDSVSGDLSLRLQDVPWDQALDTILQVKGLAMRRRGNVVWVAPAEEIASKERQALEAQNQVQELEPLVSELIQINFAKAADIADILKSVRAVDTGYESSLFGNVNITEVQTESNTLLSARGNVTVDPRTNTILIQDTPSKIREVRKLIAQLDRPVRQVLIETRIVEANDDFSRNIGARLGFTRVTENSRFPGVSDSNLGTAIGSASIEDNDLVREGGVGNRGGVSVDLSADGVSGTQAASYAFTLAKAGAGFAHLIDLEISALEAEGTGKVIANPRLLTTDQNEAHIEQGQERIFTTSVLGEGSVVTKKAVLGLTVKPQITPDDRLVLDVFVTKDTFASADDTTINTKQIETKVLLDNGETVVIGGIYEQTRSESTTKVPLLGDIPVLGTLFRKKNRFDNRTELLIFLTPRILDPALTAN